MDRNEMLGELAGMPPVPAVKRSTVVYRHMRDPALLRYYYGMKTMNLLDRLDLSGSSPTDIFIGRYGYPKVYIGPLVPPEFGDTSILGTPERWDNMTMDDIVSMRSRLVRGVHVSNVHSVESGIIEEQVRDLALAARPAVTDLTFTRKPFIRMALQDEVQPFGPSAVMKDMSIGNTTANRDVEALYGDTDAKATTAMAELYDKGLPVSKIQQGLSAGLFGLKGNRRFVPTRWSITAVDDTISKKNLEMVKEYDIIDAIMAYYHVALDNRWLILLFPSGWEYESIEAFYPNTVWNEGNGTVSIFGSYEGYRGRKEYAEMGGCYYSGRLAITERLRLMGKQASALILREVHEGYTMPVGVWNVREHVRATLEKEPVMLDGIGDVMAFVEERMEIRGHEWVRNSRMLRGLLSQRRLYEYVTSRQR